MHTHHQLFGRLVRLVPIIACTLCANGQIGPNPTEIPPASVMDSPSTLDATPISPTHESKFGSNQTASEPRSSSAAMRPVVEELLLAKAMELNTQPSAQTQPTTPVNSSSIAQEMGNSTQSIPLGKPSTRSTLIGSSNPDAKSSAPSAGWTQTILALLGVILLILGLGQLYKKLASSQGNLASQLGAGGTAPSGIIEIIGRYPVSRGMTLVVLRFDHRVLLLSHASSIKGKSGRGASMQTLCELSDPEDIASILIKARSAAGESIAQSFEQTLREADDLTDDHLHNDMDFGASGMGRVRFPSTSRQPVRTITTDEGDRAELWSSGVDSQAAAGVLRKRLASMRRGQQG